VVLFTGVNGIETSFIFTLVTIPKFIPVMVTVSIVLTAKG